MENFLVLVVLIIFIGGFIVKFGELFLALLGVIKYFALPLAIAGIIWVLPKIGHWLMGV